MRSMWEERALRKILKDAMSVIMKGINSKAMNVTGIKEFEAED